MNRLNIQHKSAQKNDIAALCEALNFSDVVVIGAGAGLSTAAGFTYDGPRFETFFSDFADRYGFRDMYSGGFYPYETLEEYWGYWSRYIYVNRFMDPPKKVYETLYNLIKEKDYFVLTTNVDHCFQKAGFDKDRLFYTQGDYGLFQCSKPCHPQTYGNEAQVREMLSAQGFSFAADGTLFIPDSPTHLKMCIPSDLIPICPECGRPMSMNLRADETFVEDDGWHHAADRCSLFLRRHTGAKILFLELGVGYNTPGIIKYPFWRYTFENTNAVYACLNKGQAAAPKEISSRSVCINADIAEILHLMKNNTNSLTFETCGSDCAAEKDVL